MSHCKAFLKHYLLCLSVWYHRSHCNIPHDLQQSNHNKIICMSCLLTSFLCTVECVQITAKKVRRDKPSTRVSVYVGLCDDREMNQKRQSSVRGKNCSWFLILEILKKSPFGWGPHRSLISPSLLSLFGFCAFVKDGFTAFLLTSLSSSLSWFSQFMGQNNVPYLKKVRLPYTKHTAKCLTNPLLRTDDCFAKFKFVLESNGIM